MEGVAGNELSEDVVDDGLGTNGSIDYRSDGVFTNEELTAENDFSRSLDGMEFATWEEVYEMYVKHSQAWGFSVRKGTTRREDGPDTPFLERYFVCSAEGTHGSGSRAGVVGLPDVANKQKRNAAVSRCQCKASVRTQVNDGGKWEVLHHIVEHNHELTPTQWQEHHRSERRITAAEGDVIRAMTEAFVAPTVQYRVAAAVAGGDVFVGHTKRDHINYVHRLKAKAIEGGDATTLINMLIARQAEDPGFFFRVQFGEDNRLRHLFWCDAMMREDYRLYHDVLIFDTTYRTNRYNLICGAFVGINNHWSNVMFGCAFLSDETEESFQWLFNAFNEAMGDDMRPISIFTDQDQAMSNAIDEIYPQSRHRLCQWHIQQNAISHFGSLKHDRVFQDLFNKCLSGCYSEEEFEECWQEMMSKYDLGENPWFKRLYGLRVKWSTALNNTYFSAGILSSQRSESTNHAMGFQASKTTSVTEFYGIFEMTVRRWRGEEERKEFNCIRTTPTSVFPLVDLLQHASQIYTLQLFRVFEREFGLAMGTRAAIIQSEDSTLLYKVVTVASESRGHHVTYDCRNMLVECTCRKYEVVGVLCAHVIRVLHMHSVPEIPARYILRRWTKFAKKDVWERILPADLRRSAANNAINWRRSMLTKLNSLITKSQLVGEAREVLEKYSEIAADEISKLLQKLVVGGAGTQEGEDAPVIRDPIRCTTKGRSQRKKRKVGKRKATRTPSGSVQANQDEYTPVARLLCRAVRGGVQGREQVMVPFCVGRHGSFCFVGGGFCSNVATQT